MFLAASEKLFLFHLFRGSRFLFQSSQWQHRCCRTH